jgi:hypothetical protein
MLKFGTNILLQTIQQWHKKPSLTMKFLANHIRNVSPIALKLWENMAEKGNFVQNSNTRIGCSFFLPILLIPKLFKGEIISMGCKM